MKDYTELQKLLNEINSLKEEREACNQQYRGTIDDAQKVILKRKLDNYDNQIDNLEQQLDELYQQLTEEKTDENKGNNRRYLAATDKLPKIDFKEQIKIVKDILDEIVVYSYAIFFIDNSLNMAGDLFSLKLQKLLDDEITDLKHYPVSFSNAISLDKIGFLEILGSHLGINEIKNEVKYSELINKILNSIRNGSVIFIELKKIDLLENKESFMSWLVDVFWADVIQKLPLTCQEKDLGKVGFFILVIDNDIFEKCSSQNFFYQISRIELKKWSKEDIKNWLKIHSGLPTWRINMIAENVYQSSYGGIPKLVRDALINKLNDLTIF